MNTTTLCIIDMQTGFIEDEHKPVVNEVIDQVINQIRLAKRRKSPIILVEFWGYNSTLECIKKAIGNSGCRSITVTKDRDDGGRNIVDAAWEAGISDWRFRLCGINRTACVLRTAWGLTEHSPHSLIDIQWDATTNVDYKESEKDIVYYEELLEKHKNVKVIGYTSD